MIREPAPDFHRKAELHKNTYLFIALLYEEKPGRTDIKTSDMPS